MNRTSLSLSMMTLGIVIGITATHFKHVHELAAYDLSLQIAAKKNANAQKQDLPSDSLNATAVIPRSERGVRHAMILNRSDERKKTKSMSAQEDALLEILVAIRAEQKALRKQISESNRDIDELTFRVDTHSDSFKPLHSVEERPRSIQRVMENYDADGSGLLPSKQ